MYGATHQPTPKVRIKNPIVHRTRLRNSETTAIFANDRAYRYPFNQGIFIDIFPIDHVPADPRERSGLYKELNRLGNRAWQWRNMIHFYRPKRGKGVVSIELRGIVWYSIS